jgi:ABC-type uncharacterized transport system permease subunit|tara:strand:- start:393 stop:578 length:186 start_codon:yes stop_codon:yes gene_type:complete
MSNDALDGLVIVFIIAVMLTSTVLGYALARRGIEEDCALMNAFRIDERVYMCMQEYTYEDY